MHSRMFKKKKKSVKERERELKVKEWVNEQLCGARDKEKLSCGNVVKHYKIKIDG